MPQPYIDEMGVTHYNDATGSGTIADPYIPKVAVTGLDVSSLQVTNDENNPVPVTANTLPLPTGAATSANQTTANTSLSNIDGKLPALSNGKIPVEVGSLNVSVSNASLEIANDVGNPVPISDSGGSITVDGTFWQATQPISAANLPLPSGAATSANQSTTNTFLSSIDGKIPALVNGRLPVDTTAAQGQAWESEATITRAANTTGYIANDVYGTVFQLTNIGSSGGFIFLNSLDIVFNLTALPSGMGSFIVYLYSSSPPSAITDNNPFSVASGDRASILTLNGLSLTASLARGGGSVVAESLNINQLFKLATGSTSLWGYLVTTGAFNPAANSETAIITARSFAP